MVATKSTALSHITTQLFKELDPPFLLLLLESPTGFVPPSATIAARFARLTTLARITRGFRASASALVENSHFKTHPKSDAHFADQKVWENHIPKEIYSTEDLAAIHPTHRDPIELHAKVALFTVRLMRSGFDFVSRYKGPGGGMKANDWVNRAIFLETIAGVPGMVAGMVRHLRSLRTMQRDQGWIHTLLEEAENERMHLLIFMTMKSPGPLFRLFVLGAQGVFFNAFFLAYLTSPKTCHRFVGYLEEEAIHTYTALVKDIEDGHVDGWQTDVAPLIARNYYKLPETATVLDMIKCIRADEAHHRDANHTFADLEWKTDANPFMHKHQKPTSSKSV
ncbi:alternative oxidase, mitochondrial precursor [Achlya hypogyna]|uniref:Alternative oxidase, mitochondrial n=1 Tax=Achlya hypogyna TaxID=1202772 RepID=A0A1V9Z6A5_ACHHY|nr:alternative oxidase, mitochondrial precursor [Achlya hypogyna]